MKIICDENFIRSWNSAFAKSFKWKKFDDLVLKINLRSYKFIAPWHPILFSENINDNLKLGAFSKLEKKHNKVYGLNCIPIKNIPESKRSKLMKENLTIHYIDIHNKDIKDLFYSYKSKIRWEIRSGFKKFEFIKLTKYQEFLKRKIEIKNMLLIQSANFCSPYPPIELLENLFLKNVLDIYLAIYKNEVVAFSSLSKDKYIIQMAWFAKKSDFRDQHLGISFNHFCLEESIKKGAKIFSLGTSSSKSLEKFKEKLNAEKALLVKRNIINKCPSKNLEFIKTSRNKINLTIMKIIIRLTIILFGYKCFEFISKEIWKRFD